MYILHCRFWSDHPVPAGCDPSERSEEGGRLDSPPGGLPPWQGGQLPNSNHVSTVKKVLKKTDKNTHKCWRAAVVSRCRCCIITGPAQMLLHGKQRIIGWEKHVWTYLASLDHGGIFGNVCQWRDWKNTTLTVFKHFLFLGDVKTHILTVPFFIMIYLLLYIPLKRCRVKVK